MQVDLVAQIARWRENLLDLDIVVDDCRRRVDHELAAFLVAVRERDRAAVHLAHLIELHEGRRPC